MTTKIHEEKYTRLRRPHTSVENGCYATYGCYYELMTAKKEKSGYVNQKIVMVKVTVLFNYNDYLCNLKIDIPKC